MRKGKKVILIMTDQQRYDTIAGLGNEKAITPNLDALIKDSTVFENCYTPAPVCAPARLSIYSGMYCSKHGSSNNGKNIVYYGDGLYGMLSDAGVKTCGIGKMHFVNDAYALHGFNKRITQEEIPNPEDEYTQFIQNSPYKHVIDYNGERSEMYYIPQISQLPQEYHPTAWIGDKAVEYISQMDSNTDDFLMISFIHPHPPFCPPVPWNKIHRDEMYQPFVPENSEDFLCYHNYAQNEYKGMSAGIDRHLVTVLRNYYYNCITFVDYQIGRIVEELKKKGIYDDAMIIFTADHGELLGDYNGLGKRCMLNAVTNVPFIIKNPEVKPGVLDKAVSLVDILPTVMDYYNLEIPKDYEYDGTDVFKENDREFVYSQFSNGETGLYMVASSHDKMFYSKTEDKYWYFDKFPEEKNIYDENNLRCQQMKKLIAEYVDSDRAVNKVTEKVNLDEFFKDYRYRLVKQDSLNRQDEEKAMLPKGYDIDLDFEFFWKRSKK